MIILLLFSLPLFALLTWEINRFWLDEQWQQKLAKVLPDINRV